LAVLRNLNLEITGIDAIATIDTSKGLSFFGHGEGYTLGLAFA
jgi:hypothetical protein